MRGRVGKERERERESERERERRVEDEEDRVQSVQIAPVAQLNEVTTLLLVIVMVAKFLPCTAVTFTHFHPPPALAPSVIVLVMLIAMHGHAPSKSVV